MSTGRKIVIVVLLLLILGGSGLWWIASARGFSARQDPTHLEAMIARNTRIMAIPSTARNLKNPVPLTPDVLVEARHHFADHCAICHDNDGGGNTVMGRNLYPRVPDMRQRATQSLSDGEIYFIIENGIRLTGMPAWGEGSDHDHESWELVHFIRHLPSLSEDELNEMEKFNPRSPAELREEQQEEEFLKGTPERKSH